MRKKGGAEQVDRAGKDDYTEDTKRGKKNDI